MNALKSQNARKVLKDVQDLPNPSAGAGAEMLINNCRKLQLCQVRILRRFLFLTGRSLLLPSLAARCVHSSALTQQRLRLYRSFQSITIHPRATLPSPPLNYLPSPICGCVHVFIL
jgi:hypothetical protein